MRYGWIAPSLLPTGMTHYRIDWIAWLEIFNNALGMALSIVVSIVFGIWLGCAGTAFIPARTGFSLNYGNCQS